jgi:hypothetical protein
MKKNGSCLNALAIGLMLALAFSCSETEPFVKGETPASGKNEAEQSVPVPVLTKSEAVALTVQQKGTYDILESEAIQNLNRFHVSALDYAETGTGTTSSAENAQLFLNCNGYTAGSAAAYSYTGVWNAG